MIKYAKCKVCGKEFELVHGKGKLVCSKECLGKLRSSMFKKDRPKSVCRNCGKEFIPSSQNIKQSFCCRDCYWQYRKTHNDYDDIFSHRKEESREKRKCEMCGKEFTVYKKDPRRFCSDECRVKYQGTKEFNDKRFSTMLQRYGKKTIGNGGNTEKLKEYEENRRKKYDELCKKSDMTLLDYIDRHVLLVRCNKCGEEFVTNNLSYVQYDKILCKHCDAAYKDYKPAIKICELLDSLGVGYVKNDRTIIKPYELDIVIKSKNIAIEVDGNFWHSQLAGKDNKYHISKTMMCGEKGIRLIHIFEDEIINKWNIVESRIKSLLGLSERIYARKCEVADLSYDDKHSFLNLNHIQGDSNSSVNIGLIYNGDIVAVMTFSKERVIYNGNSKDGRYELVRYANKIGTTVVGGFSRLLSHFIKDASPLSIKTFCDVRWSGTDYNSTVYCKCGFSYDGISKPNYWYMKNGNLLERKHRYNFTKHIILKKNPELDHSKTEWQLMQELGYNRIFDCGNMKFTLTLDNQHLQ